MYLKVKKKKMLIAKNLLTFYITTKNNTSYN